MKCQGLYDQLRGSSSLPAPSQQPRTKWGRGGVWRGRGRKIRKFSRVRTQAMIENSGAYTREPPIAPTGKCRQIFMSLTLSD